MESPSQPLILAVDDEPLNLALLRHALVRFGYEVVCALSVAAAREEIAARIPDLILLDISMPGESGLDMLRELRDSEFTKALPIIMVSALTGTDTIVTGLESGANDYVTKPVDIPVLVARIRTQLQAATRLRQLDDKAEQMELMAMHDELTGLPNRRAFFEEAARELARGARNGKPTSLLALDIDKFKRVNDTHGHAAGDRLLQQFARVVSGNMRTQDLLARIGGEEFAVLLPETGLKGARSTAERIREQIAAAKVLWNGVEISVTTSIGVATDESAAKQAPEDLMGKADKALYMAKESGRNRVCVATPIPDESQGTEK